MAKRKRNNDMLQDGEVGRVRMSVRDGAGDWRSPGDPFHVFAGDGLADGMNRPGFRVFANDAGREAKEVARDEYEGRLTNAWRDDSGINGVGERGLRGAKAGDICTCRGPEYPESFGAPGHLVEMNGRLVCKPDAATGDATVEGDRCMVGGTHGHLRRINNKLVCIPDDQARDDPDLATSDHQTMARVYDAYDANLQNAWRGIK